MNDEIHFEPDVRGTIEACRAKNYGWRDIFGELIDNAFDAGATSVDIVVNKKEREIIVSDNGDGCGDFESMLTMGKHTPHRKPGLGRYGVGLKDASWWVGGTTSITSHHRGKRHTISVDWDRLTRWSLPRPMMTTSSGVGTSIRFLGINRKLPEGKQWDDLVSDIGFIYSPAIRNGRQISFRRGRGDIELAKRYELPPGLTNVIEDTISVEGKSVRLMVGMVPEGVQNPKPGINYTHRFRVIIPSTALGCGGMGCSRIAGWVSLDDSWRLSRNKDDISANKDELADAVYERIKGLVAVASKQAMTLRSAVIAKSLTAELRGILGDSEKEKRDPKTNQTGAVEPKNTGRKRTPKKTQPGSGVSKRAGSMTIEFKPFKDDSIGSVDRDGYVIWLSDSHPRIKEALESENRLALMMTAVMLFAARDADSPNPVLPFFRDGSTARGIELAAGKMLGESPVAFKPVKLVA